MKHFLLFLCLLLAAGCTSAVEPTPRVVTATPVPAPANAGPVPTYFDPAKQHVVVQNEADMLAATLTAQAINRVATQAVIAAATQQVEQFNAGSTQAAIAVAATATVAQLSLQRQQIDATATVVALGQARTVATAQAADALNYSTEAQQRAHAEAWAELDRQTDFVLRLAAAALVVIGGALLIFYGARWLSVVISIDARKRLVMERAGLLFDHRTGEWRVLPGRELPLALPEPRPIPVINRLIPARDTDIEQERNARLAWRESARRFLRWGEVLDTFASRPMTAAGACSESDWRIMVGFLADMGFLVKPREKAAYELPFDQFGRRLTTTLVIRAPRWCTSFDLPSPDPPAVATPPAFVQAQPHATAASARTHAVPQPADVLEAETVATFAARAPFDPARDNLLVPYEEE